MRRLTASETRLIVAALAAACGAGVVFAWRTRMAAAQEAVAARAEYGIVLAQSRRAAALRTESAVIADRPRAEPDLVARLQACLHASGIDPAALTQVSASEPQGAGGANGAAQLKRQQVAITLDPVRPADLSRFLAAWREAEPLWTVRAVRAQHAGSGRSSSQAGAAATDDRCTAVLVLDNVFIASAAPAGRTAAREGTP